jgi:ABC-type Mn2+/Zn2+ transport system ATPase subunit
MNKIEFKIDRSRIEGVQNMDNEFFPGHFLALICGWPGSGKTSLLKFMLKHPKILYEKFDEIWILSPSVDEWGGLFLPKENLCNELSW